LRGVDAFSSRRHSAYPRSRAEASPTATRLLEAARRLLETSGFDALTFEAIGREAGVTSSLIRYHFGDKAGLLVALIDWVMIEDLADLRGLTTRTSSSQEAVAALLDVSEALVSDTSSSAAFFHLLPRLLQDQRTRYQLAELYTEYRSLNSLPLASQAVRQSRADVSALAVLTVAVTDGLMIQRLIGGETVDIRSALSLWGRFMRTLLEGADHVLSDDEIQVIDQGDESDSATAVVHATTDDDVTVAPR
jgi:AcrR family transcriptional regulator